MKRSIIIIPAYNPEPEFLGFISDLLQQPVDELVVVDDGSGEESAGVFGQLEQLPGCTVLRHAENRGKGRALKTAFQFLSDRTDEPVIVTADADGQHAVEDIAKLAESLKQQPAGMVLGVRDFDQKDVPPRSVWGNKLTSRVFRLLFGRQISDTQTGLRGFSFELLPWLLQLRGERFEYEMNMLMAAILKKIPIREMKIRTLYFEKNKQTHYKALGDSYRIGKQLWIGWKDKRRLYEGSGAEYE